MKTIQVTTLQAAATHLLGAAKRPDRAGYIALVRAATPMEEQGALLTEETLEKLWTLFRAGRIGLPTPASDADRLPSLQQFGSLLEPET